MKKIIFLLFIVFIGCSPKTTKGIEQEIEKETINIKQKDILADESNIFFAIETDQINILNNNEELFEYVSLPYSILINNNIFKIYKSGLIIYNDTEFKIKNDEFKDDEIVITLFHKDNLLGINVGEQTEYGGMVEYTLVINIENNNEILNFSMQEIRDSCLGFASLDNLFLVIYNTQIFSYDSINEDLLWRQTFLPANYNRMYIFYEDHFIIDELDGNEYKVYIDGRKEYIQGGPLDRSEPNRRQSFNKIRYVRRDE